ncbi:MAG: DEAD/DEAH box helicase [Fusobacteriaceae bacterium]
MELKDIRDFSEEKIIALNCPEKIERWKEYNKNYPAEISRTGENYCLHTDRSRRIFPSQNNQEFIDRILDKGQPYIMEFLSPEEILIKTFNLGEREFELNLFVDEEYFEKNRAFSLEDQNRRLAWLKRNFLMTKKYKNLSAEDEKNREDFSVLGNCKDDKDEFILSGTKNYIKIKKVTVQENGEKREVFKVDSGLISEENLKNSGSKYNFYLMRGKINFVNNTKEAVHKRETEIKLKKIKESSSSYLKSWKKYEKEEKEATLEEFISFGYVTVEKKEPSFSEGKVTLYLKNGIDTEVFENVSDKTLLVINKNPEELLAEFTEEKYVFFLEDKELRKVPINFKKINQSAISGETSIEAEMEKKELSKLKNIIEKEEGYLIFSTSGSDTIRQRRERARDLIANGKSAMPGLNLIIEGEQGNLAKRDYISPLSEKVESKIFPNHPPTPVQRKAIELALNTPDMVLIQGPPGTGKTTVITAILSRLQELDKKIGGIFARNLVTSFQHDAVINAIERVKILGLDSMKLDQKGERLVVFRQIQNTINQTVSQYYEEYPSLQENKEKEEIIELFSQYKHSIYGAPEKNQCLKLLDKLSVFVKKTENSGEFLKRIDEIKIEILGDKRGISKFRRIFFSKLPTSKIMFEDNGRLFIEMALEELEKNEVFEDEKILLEGAKKFLRSSLENEEYLFQKFATMKAIKLKFLAKMNPVDNIYTSQNTNAKINELFEEIGEYIESLERKNPDYTEDLRLYYLKELENNPLRIQRSIQNYVNTIGATCQGTQSKDVLRSKKENIPGVTGNSKKSYLLEEYEKYDNVLIDEAARSTPLDLLIPMSLAKNRIILVGDHKQLPQIIDDAILSKIKNDEEDDTTKSLIEKHIQQSMFETLMSSLKKLTEKDGIERVITLDKQYRMHPVMGDFVSRIFYETEEENRSETRKIASPRPSSEFNYNLGDIKEPLVWFDVPYTKTNEEKKDSRGSTYRTAEASEIAKFIAGYIDDPSNKNRTFGVITFYAKQREEILKALSDYGITKPSKSGYKIKDKYRNYEIEDGIIEKLRVGTVDAFQGMEFDFVFLSMVRSNKISNLESQKRINQKYGFLTYYNRLCVAMSRQKRMIGIFGDGEMLNFEGIEDIRPLREFYKICREGGKNGKYIIL